MVSCNHGSRLYSEGDVGKEDGENSITVKE